MKNIYFQKVHAIRRYRSSKSDVTTAVADSIKESEYFILGIAPEGTRRKVEKLRTGFYIIAKKAGVEESEILLEENAKNTQQNAEFTAEIIKKNGFKRVILVTSPYHQNRAFLEFRKALEGTNVEIYNAPAEQDSDFSQDWWLTTRGWYLAISEIVGIFRFYIR